MNNNIADWPRDKALIVDTSYRAAYYCWHAMAHVLDWNPGGYECDESLVFAYKTLYEAEQEAMKVAKELNGPNVFSNPRPECSLAVEESTNV